MACPWRSTASAVLRGQRWVQAHWGSHWGSHRAPAASCLPADAGRRARTSPPTRSARALRRFKPVVNAFIRARCSAPQLVNVASCPTGGSVEAAPELSMPLTQVFDCVFQVPEEPDHWVKEEARQERNGSPALARARSQPLGFCPAVHQTWSQKPGHFLLDFELILNFRGAFALFC